ncbi:MOSC domain-containing protein [Geodermatophilus sabuli]|uniref:MOSC domain-containing protein YiiM n=1 Tax=Geodermatophilus sabuli TaxID=1564158 RepID=A0A285E8J3_9ACTN|nr:MOSC domain-containing protein [Geodermatophilus sabuli]MBB3082598.1 MOSC domain-containing protein YiiM [Geodermatophilus sabuli]SNX94534.1 MOSC domain-containing protein YiiM [Geodermatophilus sabuli]
MIGRLDAVCVSGSELLPLPGRRPGRSGIDKKPVAGRVAVGELGLDGDVQVNRKYHGGEGQALYAYAQEDADWWVAELDRELPPGRFGENLRTSGLDLTEALLGERWRVGMALLEVTAPRIPCANFARFWDVPDLVRRFTARGTVGTYLRVLETGEVGAGDEVEVVDRPDHEVSVGLVFRAYTTQKYRLPQLEPALRYLPLKDQPKIAARIAARTAAVL